MSSLLLQLLSSTNHLDSEFDVDVGRATFSRDYIYAIGLSWIDVITRATLDEDAILCNREILSNSILLS